MSRYLLVVLTLVALIVSVSAVAAATTTFSYTITHADPDMPRRPADNGVSCGVSSSAFYHYRTVRFHVTEDGAYQFEDLRNGSSLIDGLIGFYTGTFNPDNVGANCFRAIDDKGPAFLDAGRTYTMVLTTYHPDDAGNVLYEVTGPGDFVIGGAPDDAVAVGQPCENVSDGRINNNAALDCAAPVAVYIVDGRVDVYAVNPNTGEGALVIQSAPESEDGAPDATVEASGNILLGSSGNIRLYWLPATSEYLLQATYADGKPYEIVWSGDGSNLRHVTA